MPTTTSRAISLRQQPALQHERPRSRHGGFLAPRARPRARRASARPDPGRGRHPRRRASAPARSCTRAQRGARPGPPGRRAAFMDVRAGASRRFEPSSRPRSRSAGEERVGVGPRRARRRCRTRPPGRRRATSRVVPSASARQQHPARLVRGQVHGGALVERDDLAVDVGPGDSLAAQLQIRSRRSPRGQFFHVVGPADRRVAQRPSRSAGTWCSSARPAPA